MTCRLNVWCNTCMRYHLVSYDSKTCIENNMRIKIYRDRNNEWRWTLYSKNKKKIANAGEGYKRRATMLRVIYMMFPTVEFIEGEKK